ncbi:MAG: DEAD/DEAH box helicase [Gemmatimonadota bacterium]|nr:DEAD/DEAH box helicase [Gemmatimonadota bacterium]
MIVRPSTLRAVIARVLKDDDRAPELLREIRLQPHQRDAIARLRGALAREGGALLADEVGLGKTFVAAALMAEARSAAVLAPAALRSMWSDALERAGITAPVTSYESLSRGRLPPPAELVVLDEAHHARTPATRRYRAIAELASHSRVLLLSATPIHNSPRDLAALLALFLGARAWTLDDAGLAHHVIRRERGDVSGWTSIPTTQELRWLPVGNDAPLLEELLALPSPLPPSDGGVAGALLVWSLVRQWASSHGALAAALRRRLARALSLGAALEAGRHPSRLELTAWSHADDALQLAFPELVSSPTRASRELLETVRNQEKALRSILPRVTADAPRMDGLRARSLRDVRERHPGEKIVAFTHSSDTLSAIYGQMRSDPGVAALDGDGALVAGGTLTRRDAIRRFAPIGSGACPAPRAESIDLLLATDLLSEGVNLQDASVVVHLDLPWTPARLEQRVGRARRMGSEHPRVAVYALAPPASVELLLGVERRLREKLAAASRVVGSLGSILPPAIDRGTLPGEGEAQKRERLRRVIGAWRSSEGEDRPSRVGMLVAGVRSARSGFLALVIGRDGAVLIGALDEAVGDSSQMLLDVIEVADGAEVEIPATAIDRALNRLRAWAAQRDGAVASGRSHSIAAPGRREAIRRLARIASHAPFHRRAGIAAMVQQGRRIATAPFGIGAERVLDELATTRIPDEAWLRALTAFGQLHAPPGDQAEEAASPTVAALLLLVAEER